MMMTGVPLDELGPVDYVVVEFPAGASNFTGEMAAELRRLVDGGIIRLIDALILTKDADSTVDAMELSDVGELGELREIEAQMAELLAEDDVENLAAATKLFRRPLGRSGCSSRNWSRKPALLAGDRDQKR
jgi:hypothetical protein